jgi:tetrahydromethanopterin S-methyltransferase subunit E
VREENQVSPASGGGGVTNYDENILQQYADDLYQQAKWIVVMSALRYGLVVFLVSFGISMIVASSQMQISTDAANSGVAMVMVLFLTLLAVVVGVDAGRRKAFMLKLQAQQILCQRQTELNTRK